MPILTFKVSKEVAETVNTLAKRNGISRNEFLTRAIISLLLQEDLKGRDVRKLTAPSLEAHKTSIEASQRLGDEGIEGSPQGCREYEVFIG